MLSAGMARQFALFVGTFISASIPHADEVVHEIVHNAYRDVGDSRNCMAVYGPALPQQRSHGSQAVQSMMRSDGRVGGLHVVVVVVQILVGVAQFGTRQTYNPQSAPTA